MIPPPPRSTLFPYTTLFRSLRQRRYASTRDVVRGLHELAQVRMLFAAATRDGGKRQRHGEVTCLHYLPPFFAGDRKSTRLNSSHGYISYAVFCLKKKNEIHR